MLIYIIKKLFPNKFINYLREKKIILNWYLKNKPTSPPHSIKQKTIKKYAKKYNIKTFIETGTYKGEMIEATKNIFKKIYSIELDNDLWTKAIEKFKDDKYIKILNGDSGEILPKLLKKINNPCIFWLDGHYSGGITARGELNTPIFKELEAVLNHKIKNHVILIDNARCFTGGNDYPTIKDLKSFIIDKNSKLKINIKNDIIRITY